MKTKMKRTRCTGRFWVFKVAGKGLEKGKRRASESISAQEMVVRVKCMTRGVFLLALL